MVWDWPLVAERKKSWRGRWIGGERRRSTKQRPKRNIWLKSMMHWFVIFPLSNKHKLQLNSQICFFSQGEDWDQQIICQWSCPEHKTGEQRKLKGCFCLNATRVFTSFWVCSLKRPRPNATISWWSSTMSSCRRYKTWNQRLKRLMKSSKVALCFVWSPWLSDVNACVLLQLQGAVEADFQEKFHCLPGEIQEFLQERRAEVRGNSKSRPSTPHETLSEEDWDTRKCVRTSGGQMFRDGRAHKDC